MGGAGNQIIGYRYYMGIHMGISRGPINELVEIKVGDRTAWSAFGGSGGYGVNGYRVVWNAVVSELAPEPHVDGIFGAMTWWITVVWIKPSEGYKPYRMAGDEGWQSDAVWDAGAGYWLFTPPDGTAIRVYVNAHDAPPGVDTTDPDVALQAYKWINVNTTTNVARTWTGVGWAAWVDGTADTAGTGGSDPGGGTGGSGGGLVGGGGGGGSGGGGVGNGRYNIP